MTTEAAILLDRLGISVGESLCQCVCDYGCVAVHVCGCVGILMHACVVSRARAYSAARFLHF